MDGVAAIHQSFSTPVLQVLSDNKFVVKIDRLFIPRVAWRNGTNMGPGAESGNEMKP